MAGRVCGCCPVRARAIHETVQQGTAATQRQAVRTSATHEAVELILLGKVELSQCCRERPNDGG